MSSSLILCNNHKPFLGWIWHDRMLVLYNNWQWPQLSVWTEKKLQSTSQSQTYTKKNHGHCLVVCCSSVPVLKTGTPLTLELQCQGDIGQQKGPNSSAQKCLITCCITNTSKVEWIGLRSFASSSIFTWPFTNYHFFKQLENFCKDCFHNQQDAENTFQEFIKSQA